MWNALFAEHICHYGRTLSNCAGLIQHNRINAMGRFQGLRRFNQDTVACALSGSDHNGRRRCKAQRTGAGNDQNGNADRQGKFKAISQQQPDNNRDQRDADNYRHKHAADLISQFRNRGLGAGRFIHQPDDLCQRGIIAHLGGLHLEIAGLTCGRADHFVPDMLLHGDALAGQGRFINGGKALDDNTIHRHRLTGLDNQGFAQLHFFHRHLKLFSVPLHSGRFGGQIHQLCDCVRSLTLCAGFQGFTQGDKGQDHACGFKIQIHHKAVNRSHIPMTKSNADFVNGVNAINNCGAGAYRNQRIHVRRAVEQGLEAHPVIFEVDKHHRDQQQELGKCKADCIFHPQQGAGERPPHHVAHRNIKQRDRKKGRKQQPLFHLLVFCLCRTDLRFCCRCGRSALVLCGGFGNRAITGLFNGLDDSRRIQNGFIIRSNHAVF